MYTDETDGMELLELARTFQVDRSRAIEADIRRRRLLDQTSQQTADTSLTAAPVDRRSDPVTSRTTPLSQAR
jgi:hypothetical protein